MLSVKPPRFAISILLVIGEADCLWQRCLQVVLKELAEPALSQYEVHVDALLTRTAASVAKALPTVIGRRKRSLTLAANLPCISLPHRGRPLSAHAEINSANNTLSLTYGLGLSTGTAGGSITLPGAPSSGPSNSGGGSVGWPGTGLGLSLGSSGALGSSFGNGLSGSPFPPFGGSMYHNFNTPLQVWPNPCQ
jgi:hypothetical protein